MSYKVWWLLEWQFLNSPSEWTSANFEDEGDALRFQGMLKLQGLKTALEEVAP